MLPPSRGRVIFCDSRENEGTHGVIHRRNVATPPTPCASGDSSSKAKPASTFTGIPDLSGERQKKSNRSHRQGSKTANAGTPSDAFPPQEPPPSRLSLDRLGVCTPDTHTSHRLAPVPDNVRLGAVTPDNGRLGSLTPCNGRGALTPDNAFFGSLTPDNARLGVRAGSLTPDAIHSHLRLGRLSLFTPDANPRRRLGAITPDSVPRSHLDPLDSFWDQRLGDAPEQLRGNLTTPHSQSSVESDKFTRASASSGEKKGGRKSSKRKNTDWQAFEHDQRTESSSSGAVPNNRLSQATVDEVQTADEVQHPCLDTESAKPIDQFDLTPSGTADELPLSPEHEMFRHLSESPFHGKGRPLDLRNWKQGELLGRGSSGEVYKAMCGGQFLAVKKIKLQVGSNAASKKEAENLRTEIELLNRLDHPRIVRYTGCLVEEDCGSPNVLIFMEYMPSGSLSSVMKKFGPYGLQLVKKYTRQILEGLAFLHSKGIVHRDVKGANVLVDHMGEAKLADFGACKQLEVLHSTLSGGLGEVKGSIFWMAPETATGTSGRRCDIWSAGCVVIEMLTARPPWTLHRNVKNWSLLQALQHIIESNEIPPIPETCDPKCHDFLLQCLVREHRQRPYAHKLLNHEFLL